MPRPKSGYRLADGSRVSGVTTILENLGWNKRGLCYWNWQQGAAGAEFGKSLEHEATLGTLIHGLIEAELRGLKAPDIPAEHKDRADNAVLAFYEWRDAFRLETTGSEVALVSETHQFGGTIDYPVRLRGRRAILDLKTSRETYPDHRIQLSAYGRLWDENNPGDLATGYHLLRVDKETGGFSHHYFPSLNREWELFLLLLQIHAMKKELS